MRYVRFDVLRQKVSQFEYCDIRDTNWDKTVPNRDNNQDKVSRFLFVIVKWFSVFAEIPYSDKSVVLFELALFERSDAANVI